MKHRAKLLQYMGKCPTLLENNYFRLGLDCLQIYRPCDHTTTMGYSLLARMTTVCSTTVETFATIIWTVPPKNFLTISLEMPLCVEMGKNRESCK